MIPKWNLIMGLNPKWKYLKLFSYFGIQRVDCFHVPRTDLGQPLIGKFSVQVSMDGVNPGNYDKCSPYSHPSNILDYCFILGAGFAGCWSVSHAGFWLSGHSRPPPRRQMEVRVARFVCGGMGWALIAIVFIGFLLSSRADMLEDEGW